VQVSGASGSSSPPSSSLLARVRWLQADLEATAALHEGGERVGEVQGRGGSGHEGSWGVEETEQGAREADAVVEGVREEVKKTCQEAVAMAAMQGKEAPAQQLFRTVALQVLQFVDLAASSSSSALSSPSSAGDIIKSGTHLVRTLSLSVAGFASSPHRPRPPAPTPLL
jgi:hypothetical protein